MSEESEGLTLLRYVDERFKHLEQLFTLSQDNAKRAVDKAEVAQAAHNVAQNEWRQTLTDFRQNVPSRNEYDRLSAEVAAYKLEITTSLTRLVASRETSKEGRDDSKSWIAIAVAVLAVVVAYFKHG